MYFTSRPRHILLHLFRQVARSIPNSPTHKVQHKKKKHSGHKHLKHMHAHPKHHTHVHSSKQHQKKSEVVKDVDQYLKELEQQQMQVEHELKSSPHAYNHNVQKIGEVEPPKHYVDDAFDHNKPTLEELHAHHTEDTATLQARLHAKLTALGAPSATEDTPNVRDAHKEDTSRIDESYGMPNLRPTLGSGRSSTQERHQESEEFSESIYATYPIYTHKHEQILLLKSRLDQAEKKYDHLSSTGKLEAKQLKRLEKKIESLRYIVSSMIDHQ